jgi:hypothetical protein
VGFSREKVLGLTELPREWVPTPEWAAAFDGEADKCGVWVQALSGSERDQHEQAMLYQREKSEDGIVPNIRAMLLVRSIIHEDGAKVFRPSDVKALGQLSAAALDRCYTVASKLSGIGPEQAEEMEKNSETAPGSSSFSS